MIEDAVSWTGLGDLLTTIVLLAGAVGGVWWRLHVNIRSVEKDLDAYKLEVAKNYATNNAISQVEERVVQAIERLGDRLDRFLERGPRAR